VGRSDVGTVGSRVVMMMMGESVYNGHLSRCILCCLRFWFCECIAGSVCAARLCALLVLVLILVLRRWEAGGVSGSAFRVLAVAAALSAACLYAAGSPMRSDVAAELPTRLSRWALRSRRVGGQSALSGTGVRQRRRAVCSIVWYVSVENVEDCIFV
jgi:hypothetical protein